MCEQQRQRLSALVDGELDHFQLKSTLVACASDAELKETWSRYHLMGRVLRGEPFSRSYEAIEAEVMRQIHTQPATVRSWRQRWRLRSPGPFAGAALAAAAALVAVLVLPQIPMPERGMPSYLAKSSNPDAAPYAIESASARWSIDEPDLVAQIDRLLVSHQTYSPAAAIMGFRPFASVVGYDSSR